MSDFKKPTRSFMGFRHGDLAIYASMIAGSDRPAKGQFLPSQGKEMGFRFSGYPNHSQYRDSLNISLSGVGMNFILEAVKSLANNPTSTEEFKRNLMRPAQGGQFVPTGDALKVFRDMEDGGTITIVFRNAQSRYPTFSWRILEGDSTRTNPIGELTGEERGIASTQFAKAWVSQMSSLVQAHVTAEYTKQMEEEPAPQQGGGQQRGGQQRGGWNNGGGQGGGYQKPQAQTQSHGASDTMDFDEDLSF